MNLKTQPVGDEILQAFEKVSEIVTSTLGAYGRTVGLIQPVQNSNGEKYLRQINTKDGISVLRSLCESQDPYLRKAATLIYEGAVQKQGDEVGDGTTTTTLLSVAFYKALRQTLKENPSVNVNRLSKEVQNLAEKAIKELAKYKREVKTVEELIKIATISANNNPVIGKIVGETVFKVGQYGKVELVNTQKPESKVEFREGYRLNGINELEFLRYLTNDTWTVEKPKILLLSGDIQTGDKIEKIVGIYDRMEKQHERAVPLVVVCHSLDSSARTTWQSFLYNKYLQQKEIPKIVFIPTRASGRENKEMFSDLSLISGAKVLGNEYAEKIDSMGFKHLGEIKSFSTNLFESLFEYENVDTSEAVKTIEAELSTEKSDQERSVWLQMRLSMLKGGSIATIRIGGITISEKRTVVDFFDDAVKNSLAALKGGYVLGGGLTYYDLAIDLVDDKYARVLLSPYLKILELAGEEGNLREHRSTIGIDFANGGTIDYLEAGIYDSYLAVENAILAATSFAANEITKTYEQYEI